MNQPQASEESYEPAARETPLYPLFHQVMRLHFQRRHALLAPHGLFPGQPQMLLALEDRDGRSQKELAQSMRVQPATMTVTLNRMEKAGFVERRKDPGDQRVSRVYLTARGRLVCSEVRNTQAILENECFQGFTEEEREMLGRLFGRMRDNLLASPRDCGEPQK